MSMESRQNIGRPRFDPKERLLHRFFEPLILLRILDPTRGDQKSGLTSEPKSHSLWHRFLDQLSWICDYEPGGCTVSAIAAETTPDGPVFWLAANNGPAPKATQHLLWVLRKLGNSYNLSPTEAENLVNIITVRCIAFSRSKVKAYSQRLRSIIRKFEEFAEADSRRFDDSLLDKLRTLYGLGDDFQGLCRQAYNYRSLDVFDSVPEILSTVHSSASWFERWSALRHYIGRLGSWSKAAKTLVHVARTSPDLISGYRLQELASPPQAPPPTPDVQTNLDGALRRMFPKNEGARLQHVKETLKSSRLFDISSAFLNTYTDANFKPRVHAEIQVLEYFHHNSLPFVNSDRYIGCSKPSCYCCDLYMKFHPGTFVARPCHGNLWINWQPPTPPLADDADKLRYTRTILNEMIQRIRKDVLFQIESKMPRRPRVPDSTTGFSTGYFTTRIAAGVESSQYDPLLLAAEHFNSASDGEQMSMPSSPISDGTDEIGPIQKRQRQSESPSTDGDLIAGTQVNLTDDGDEDSDVIIFRGRTSE